MLESGKEKFPELTGVVLAGGLSSRLGQDKSGLCLAGGESLLERSVRLLRCLVPQVLVVGRTAGTLTETDAAAADCHPLVDAWPGCGPVGGIATALRHSGTDCLVISCDLPFMTRAVLERLCAAWENRRPETLLCAYRQRETGKIENLVGVYSHSGLDLFENTLAKKLLKISLVLPPERQETIVYGLEDSLPFFNLNYPADLLLAREYLKLADPR